MPNITLNKKNHEKLTAIRDEEGLKSFNEVLDKILPNGAISSMDFEIEQPAFTLNAGDNYEHVSWNELKKAETGKTWSNGEEATIIYKDEIGALIRFIDEYKEVYLNYFHFL
ncbi:hypothetical protein [uncultured Methanobrevibacter sp.]|uniref:hypothetical protein n=1 Tax=uncultured Methanobrevibacter sp. TaxID=253161 RepID=UPI002630672D|nr:hypothetical protein [uncultured Methanobrevibacter sp.]